MEGLPSSQEECADVAAAFEATNTVSLKKNCEHYITSTSVQHLYGLLI